jgi:cysteine desulfurase family protein (TIGR01976 family)
MTVNITEKLDLSPLRAEFPALSQQVAGRTAVFFDNPGGTQVHQSVIEAFGQYYRTSNSNTGGAFATSQRSDQILEEARQAMADMLNAHSWEEIIFGPNMTTLTFNLARAIGRTIQSGDEIVVTNLDHDANVAPWLTFEELGAVIKIVDINVPECTLNMESLKAALSNKTRLVAVTAASNAVGTFPDVAEVIRLAHSVGAKVFVDAVQYAPHGPIDVQSWDCDFLACSAYKFFGPHLGILYGKYELLEELQPYKVRPSFNKAPWKFETGTQNHEGMAAATAAVNYLASVGQRFGQPWHEQYVSRGYAERRLDLKMGMAVITAYEKQLAHQLFSGLARFEDLQVYGITDHEKFDRRGPTAAFTWPRLTPRQTAEYLGEHGVFVWDGNYYALSLMLRLGIEDYGGALRVGLSHYNTPEEVDYLLNLLDNVSG